MSLDDVKRSVPDAEVRQVSALLTNIFRDDEKAYDDTLKDILAYIEGTGDGGNFVASHCADWDKAALEDLIGYQNIDPLILNTEIELDPDDLSLMESLEDQMKGVTAASRLELERLTGKEE